jgi:arylsulfatase A-like enzyme
MRLPIIAIRMLAVVLSALVILPPVFGQQEDVFTEIESQVRSGNHQRVIELTTAALQDNPDLAEAYYIRGRANFCLARIENSLKDFDRCVELLPERAREQWERGITCYYAGKYEDGARQFELYQTFHDNDVENSVWRYLCLVPQVGVEEARKTMLPIRDDPRVPMMQIYDLYRGRAEVADVLEAVGAENPNRAGRLFYANLYIGLYYESLGEQDKAAAFLKKAAAARDAPGINRYMGAVADVHVKLAATRQAHDGREKPNIIFILADDLGYGDLGCYGQQKIQTPNLDRMAAEGMRFTDFYAASTVCAPSRCGLMTAYHMGHAFIRGNGKDNLRPEDVTVAEVLQSVGYRTALIGKWGLGHEGSTGIPTKQGFDYFFGYLDQHHAHNYYPSFLVRNEERVMLRNEVPGEGEFGQGVATRKVDYSHDLLIEDALRWVDENHQRPFFLYLALTIPHANNEARDEGMEVPDYGEYQDKVWPRPQKGHAAMISRMDRDVGRLMQLLGELNIDRKTAVFFSSDNGPHREGGNDPAFADSNGPLNGTKRDLTDGGIRVPFIARWPGHIPAGSTSSFVGAFWDVPPTLAELGGANRDQLPDDIDGISFAPTLLGNPDQQTQHEFLYWAFYERGGAQATRMNNWKAVQQPWDSPIRLYDLSQDIGESQDLAAKHPELVALAAERMRAAYAPSERWRFPSRKAGQAGDEN